MRDAVRRSRSVGPFEVDLPAHGILLRVERALLAAGDSAASDSRVGALFQADRRVLLMQRVRLAGGQLAIAETVDDAVLLAIKPRADLGATWVV